MRVLLIVALPTLVASASANDFRTIGVISQPAASGAVFGSFGGTVVINDQGRVAFGGGLRTGSGGVTEDNNDGIWATDITGVL